MADHDSAQAQVSDADVLADPSSFTVEQVLDVFEHSEGPAIESAKAAEAEGKGRRGIVEYEPPAEVAFSTSDKLTTADWSERASWFSIEGQAVTRHAIAGALYDVGPEETLSQREVERRLKRFLTAEAS